VKDSTNFHSLTKIEKGGKYRLSFYASFAPNDIKLDNISVRELTGVVLNNTPNETILLMNTGSTPKIESCPIGINCSEYVSETGATLNWNTTPITVAPYSARLLLWTNSPQRVPLPSCTLSSTSS